MRKLAVAFAVLFYANVAAAQPSLGGPPGLTEPSAPAPVTHKSKSTAVLLALGAFAASTALTVAAGNASGNCYGDCTGPNLAFGLALTAMVVSPSAGQIYAGRRVTGGLIMRVSGVAAMGLGLIALAPCWVHNNGVTTQPVYGGPPASNDNSACSLAAVALTGGALAAVAGTIWDFAATPSAVDAYNRKHDRPGAQLTLAPIATRTGVTPGVGLGMRF